MIYYLAESVPGKSINKSSAIVTRTARIVVIYASPFNTNQQLEKQATLETQPTLKKQAHHRQRMDFNTWCELTVLLDLSSAAESPQRTSEIMLI